MKKKSRPSKPPNSFTAWPHQPKYRAVALIKKDGLWAVLELGLQSRQVLTHNVTEYTNFEGAIDKAVRKLAQSVRS